MADINDYLVRNLEAVMDAHNKDIGSKLDNIQKSIDSLQVNLDVDEDAETLTISLDEKETS